MWEEGGEGVRGGGEWREVGEREVGGMSVGGRWGGGERGGEWREVGERGGGERRWEGERGVSGSQSSHGHLASLYKASVCQQYSHGLVRYPLHLHTTPTTTTTPTSSTSTSKSTRTISNHISRPHPYPSIPR